MTIERVIELLSRDYWFEDAELQEAKRIAVEIIKESQRVNEWRNRLP